MNDDTFGEQFHFAQGYADGWEDARVLHPLHARGREKGYVPGYRAGYNDFQAKREFSAGTAWKAYQSKE